MTSTTNRDILLDAGVPDAQVMSLDNYTFPKERLKKTLSNPNKQPLVLVSCGSFSPPTNLHLRMFEEAADYCEFETDFEVVGGFFSPVGDAYKKAGLASAQHRINMTRIAVQDSSTWIGVDPWEPLHKEYLPTVKVLDHFDHELNEVLGGIATENGEKRRIHVALLAGADLIQTMSTPGLWAREDLSRILGHYGAFILERSGTDIDDALVQLQQWRHNIRVIPQLIQNDVSSTKIRLFRKRGKSIRYYIPDKVVDYIYEHGLYSDDDKKVADKGKAAVSADAPGSSQSPHDPSPRFGIPDIPELFAPSHPLAMSDRDRDPSRRRPHGDERRRRRESHGDTDPERRRRRESHGERAAPDAEGRRRKGHRATDSQGDVLPRPQRRSRQQSDTEHESPAPRKARGSRRNSRTDGSGSRSSAPLSLEALAKLDKTNAKKSGGWGTYDYDEDYLKEVRRKEKNLEKERIKEERAEKRRQEKEEEARRRAAESDAAMHEEKARRRREERRKAAALKASQTEDELDRKRGSYTEDEREERRRRRESRYTESEAEERRERRRQDKQHRTEQKKRRVISGPLAEEGGIDDDSEYRYMMEKRGGGGAPTVYSEEELARKKKRKRILIGVLSVILLLAIIIPVAVVLSGKNSSSANTGGGSTGSASSEPSNSNLAGKDRNSVPEQDRGGILDPWSWYDTTDFNVTYTNELVGGLPIIGLNSTWNDDVQANPSVPKLSDKFEYGKTPIRGVNVGGWLNLEPFITPSFFSQYGSKDNVVDEWTFLSKLGPAKAKTTMEKHYATFITRETFAKIREAGMDHVRFPFGYWIVQTYDDDVYVPQVSWRYLLRGIEYCRQNGLRVNLDLHGAPGSQNGWNHSGRQGVIGWLNGTDGDRNAERSLEIHHKLSVFFAQDRYKNLVTMYGLVNEPRMVELDTDKVLSWTQKAIDQIRSDGITAIIIFGDGFMGLDKWQGKLQNNKNLLLDVHQYVIFNTDQIKLKHRDKLNFACEAWTQQSKRSMNTQTGFGPTMCGEWSQADTDCTQYINNVGTGSRWEGTLQPTDKTGAVLAPQCPLQSSQCSCTQANADPGSYSPEYKKWLYQFAIGQMDAFEAGWGWFYWTWETESSTQWSYRRGREAGILPDKAYDRDWKCPGGGVDNLDSFDGLSENYRRDLGNASLGSW
ncbi:glycoside hydrolase family 5 protein [Curvularia clavata]|uniref:Nicotinamide/nicotinic acid mononucleotide adenylyltransferase 3 n=1 Tax=Curvularia clavata TaxID=95742 RepID=A0A9Q8ZDD0_CURCL|nr:glycoside hydrolase family 5 protein [Curvularia clavata]